MNVNNERSTSLEKEIVGRAANLTSTSTQAEVGILRESTSTTCQVLKKENLPQMRFISISTRLNSDYSGLTLSHRLRLLNSVAKRGTSRFCGHCTFHG